ncbi:hypothetical protein PV371_20600 [Streptomyces sp. TX20-6-3]|uniref:hypothetical protein n=1 Tax=Streptomyces sp. TX20-6-3 TaxID=3028705 RepID=UPI0029B99473|nr:hypothetical protein [Streptomyces sp. TX20-6-3]MDX2562045.1 hypothetical protein [Streptomyces sp. TX20-6-3]
MRRHENRRRFRGHDRRPARRTTGSAPAPPARLPSVAGTRVVLVGCFSAKERNFGALMDSAATELAARGARIVGRFVQRRGISDGGAAKMALPFSSRTLLRSGKVHEVAAACEEARADAVVVVTPLTELQERTLTVRLGRPALSLGAALAANRPSPPAPAT